MKRLFGQLLNFLCLLLSLFLTALLIAGLFSFIIDSQLPDIESLKSVHLPAPMRIYTSEGELLAEFGELHRDLVTLDAIPPLFIKAFLAAEDRRFLEHHGIDPYGLARAILGLLTTGTKNQGASTITMQVARNFYLSKQKTFSRKLVEILLSLKIEKNFSKRQILELYLNKIFLGNRAYGIAAAAQVYYGKTLKQLTLTEMATLAGLPKAPSLLNPFVNPCSTKPRRDYVLTRMYELGYINQFAYQSALLTPVTQDLKKPTMNMSQAPYAAEMVREMMNRAFGNRIYTQGYHVYTTLQFDQQIAANRAVQKTLLSYDKRHGYRGPEKRLGKLNSKNIKQHLNTLQKTVSINGFTPAIVIAVREDHLTALLADGHTINVSFSAWFKEFQSNPASRFLSGDLIRVSKQHDEWVLTQIPKIQGALVALNPENGAITALAGGFNYALSQFNRATQAERQPGSAFKPFIYAAGLAKGFQLSNLFNDAPLVIDIKGQNKPWRPQNNSRTFLGPTRLREALVRSINLVTVRLLQAIGVPYTLNYLSRFGFNSQKLPRNLSLALGSGEVTPLELARGYAVFANGGYRVTPFLIDHIVNNNGQLIYQAQPKIAYHGGLIQDKNLPETRYAPQTIPTDIAFLITSVLKEVTRDGTGSAVGRAFERTDLAGKTGTTNDFIDTWFAGFNGDLVCSTWVGFDHPIPVKEYGSKTALPMWVAFMKSALQGIPENNLPQPSTIKTATIDPLTGALIPPNTPGAMLEYFPKDHLEQKSKNPSPPMIEPLF